MSRPDPTEEVLGGGSVNPGAVVRIGDTVRRPRGHGHEAVEALLLHLERRGFDGAPRFLGTDERGRQVLTYLPGEVLDTAPDVDDDEAVARHVGRVASMLARLHSATADFAPPRGVKPARPLPVPGSCWTHGDVVASNVLLRDREPVALLDWEFAGPADVVHDPATLLAATVRGPKAQVPDLPRRERAVRLALEQVAVGYGMTDADAARLPEAAAAVLDDAADFWDGRADQGWVAANRWRAEWFRRYAGHVRHP